MRVLVILILVFLLVPAMADAAYQNPIVIDNERLPVGSTRLKFQFSGNAGEPVVIREYMVGPGTTATILRNWVDATLDELNLMHTAATLPALQPGQTVPRLAPVVPSASAKNVWQRKAANYAQFCTHSFTGSIETACTALKGDIESTYATGFLDAQ